MPEHVCPWWVGYLLVSPVRRWLTESPAKLLAPYVTRGMTVLEPGPGMGFFTLELARLVGPTGRVIAVDVQPRMLESLKRRAEKTGLADRIDARLALAESMGLSDLKRAVDFVLAFAVVHEMPSARRFFTEVAQACKPGATLLLAEPSGHVKDEQFESELRDAGAAGFTVEKRPSVRRSHAAVLTRRKD